MLPKTNRLTKKKDFENVFKKGKGIKGDFLILRFVGNKTKTCRFGIVVSKKISKKATVRNKIKRRIRAAIGNRNPKFKRRRGYYFNQPARLGNEKFSGD